MKTCDECKFFRRGLHPEDGGSGPTCKHPDSIRYSEDRRDKFFHQKGEKYYLHIETRRNNKDDSCGPDGKQFVMMSPIRYFFSHTVDIM